MDDNPELDIFKGQLNHWILHLELEELYKYITPKLVIKKIRHRKGADNLRVAYSIPFKYCSDKDYRRL